MPSQWQDAPRVTLFDKRCPHPDCDSSEFIHSWTEDNGDGSRTQSQVCARCSRPVRWIIEPHPRDGDLVYWPSPE
jgi:hypothetical protein